MPARTSPQMFNLASSLLYQQLFNQQNNGEHVYEGSATQKTPTYNLGVKGIPDDVLWALSAVNLDQYDLPEWVTRIRNSLLFLRKFFSTQVQFKTILNDSKKAHKTKLQRNKKIYFLADNLRGHLAPLYFYCEREKEKKSCDDRCPLPLGLGS